MYKRQVRLPEAHAGQFERVDRGGPAAVDALRAEQFERSGRPAPLRQVRALEEAGPRVHQRRLRRRHVRARRHPGQARGVVEVGPPPARHPYRLQRYRSGQELPVEQPGQLGDRHAVRLRDGPAADEARELLVEDGALGGAPGDRVRPVQHHEAPARQVGRLHAVVERPDVGVEACAHVLDVEDDGVHAGGGEDVGEGAAALEVGVVDGEAGRGVVVAAFGAAGLGGPPEAVLGAEDGDEVHPVVGVHDVDDVAGVTGDAGGIGHDAHAFAAELGVAVRGEVLEARAQSPAAFRSGRPGGRGEGNCCRCRREEGSSGEAHGGHGRAPVPRGEGIGAPSGLGFRCPSSDTYRPVSLAT